MKNTLRRAGPLAVMCAVLLLASNVHAVIEIDHFEDDFVGVNTGGGVLRVGDGIGGNDPTTDSSDQSSLPNVYGGDRDATLTWVAGGGTTSATAEAQQPFPDHFLEYTNGSDDRSMLTLLYDGDAGGGNLGDLTEAGGSTGIVIRLLLADLNASIRIDATDGSSNTGFLQIDVPFDVTSALPLFFDYTLFSGSVDFTDVDSLLVTLTNVNDTEAVDFQIDAIESGNQVPEPVTMLGLFLGLGSVGAYIRKRRMA